MSATGLEQLPALPELGGPAQPLLRVDGLRKYFPVRRAWPWQAPQHVHAVDQISFSLNALTDGGVPPRPANCPSSGGSSSSTSGRASRSRRLRRTPM